MVITSSRDLNLRGKGDYIITSWVIVALQEGSVVTRVPGTECIEMDMSNARERSGYVRLPGSGWCV